jgi:hypothetical protein
MFRPRIYFDADGGGAGSSGGDGNQQQQGDGKQQSSTPPDYETWITDQPEEIKSMLSGRETGLKSALQKERDDRKKLEKDLREMAGKADKDSDAQRKLTEMADQMAESDRRAGFYEAAHSAGISNLKLAFTVAVQDEMFDRKGNVNFEEMKKSYPELFGGAAKKPTGNAGEGTNDNKPAGKSMNDFIRTAAGRS